VPELQNHDIRLHYEVHGDGQPVVFMHGATVSFKHNYADYGWIKEMNDSGFQVIGLDFRGHGSSDKPHDSQSYGTANLASDVIALLDHLHLPRASFIAYSIGTAIALHLMQVVPERFDRAALVATGDGLIGLPPYTFDAIMPALEMVLDRTEYPQDLPKHLAAYWNFIEATAGDRIAMRALSEATYPPLSTEKASGIAIPILVVSGEKDAVLGRGPRLSKALRNAEYLEIAGTDHFSLAVDAGTKAAVARFLKAATSVQRE
jgi:pimeloyl-ACP methyl ester carboxylesterase